MIFPEASQRASQAEKPQNGLSHRGHQLVRSYNAELLMTQALDYHKIIQYGGMISLLLRRLAKLTTPLHNSI